MSKKRILSVILTGILAVSISACGKKTKSEGVNETASTAVNVTVHTVQEAGINNQITYTGEIKESEYTGVSSKVSAKVLAIHAEEGQYVNVGDVLVVLDSKDLQLTYNQALANYNSAKASYDKTVNAVTQQSEMSARQSLNAAQIEYDNALAAYEREKQLYENNTSIIAARNALNDARAHLERVQQLYNMGAATQIELDTAKNNVENAQASLASLESARQASLDAAKTRYENAVMNLNSAKENFDLTINVINKENVSTAKAAVDAAKANLDIAENNLNNTKITAPISGYISKRNVNMGQMVSPGVELFTIKNTNTVEGQINVTESVIPYVKIGTPALISVKSAGIDNIEGSVTLVNQTKDATTGLYTVRVTIPNKDNVLKVGMFADITLTTHSVDNAVVIPSEAVLQENDGLYVFVANGNIAEKRQITTGISDGNNIQVISGVNVGDKIIVKGKEYLSEKNNQIRIIEETARG